MTSQFISGVTSVIAITVALLIFVIGIFTGGVDVSEALFVVLAFRLLLTSAGSIAQGLTEIGSYQPFIQPLYEYLQTPVGVLARRSLPRPPRSKIVAVFEPQPLSVVAAHQLAADFGGGNDARGARMVAADVGPRGRSPARALGFPKNCGPRLNRRLGARHQRYKSRGF